MAKKTDIIQKGSELEQSLNIISAFKSEVDGLAKSILLIKVVDDSSAGIAQQNLTKASGLLKQIEEKRKEIKEPFLQAGKQVDSTTKEIVQELEVAVVALKGEIKKYVEEIEARQREEKEKQEREAAELLRKQEEENKLRNQILDYIVVKVPEWATKKISELKSADDCDKLIAMFDKLKSEDEMGDFVSQYVEMKESYLSMIKAKKANFIAANNISEEELAILKKKEELANRKLQLAAEEREIAEAEEKAKQEAERKRLEELAKAAEQKEEKVAKTRKVWKFEVKDIDKVNPEWMKVDEDKVKEYIKANSDTLKHDSVYFGIRFFQETIVSA